MKKLILCSFFLATAVLGFSQSQRFVMFEEFTNASCGPCASQNPAFDALLNSNTSKCTSIKYHANWPGVDPMNAQNPTDAGARVTYYQVNLVGVPYAVMDGIPIPGPNYTGAPANLNQAKIDAEYAIPATFNLSMYQQLSAGNDSVFITMLGECTEAVSGSLVAQIGVIEKHIHFNSPPGTNGEKDFYNVMKKMLPTASGTILPSSFQPGDYFIVQGAWKLANVYTLSELSAVGFIQNNANKNIQQGANSTTTPLTMPYNNDVQLMSVSGYSSTNCSGNVAPVISIRNNGNNPLTSLTIKYGLDGLPPSTYTWNGILQTLEKTNITLPNSTVSLQGPSYTFNIYADQVNNVTDEYPKNDTTEITFVNAPYSLNYMMFNLHTDKAPQETTWDLRDESGNIIDSGGPYSIQSHSYTDTVHLGAFGCKKFTIYDAGGNGLCYTNGSGGYQLTTSWGSAFKTGGAFGSYEFTEVLNDWPTGVTLVERTGMKVYPNPCYSEARVTFHLDNPGNVNLNLYNSTGQIVRSLNKGNFSAGDQECTMDAHNLVTGIYMLKLQAGAQVFICKVSVNN